jgi:hypothetical protein
MILKKEVPYLYVFMIINKYNELILLKRRNTITQNNGMELEIIPVFDVQEYVFRGNFNV